MLNIAHRGFCGKYPENTMLAFRKAVEVGADGIEMDVQYTKDGQLVIIHDERVDRTCDGKGLVCEMTLEELQKLDASAGYRGMYGVNRIPTLREYFELVKPVKGFITNIELKTGNNEYKGIEKMVGDMIREFGLEDRIIISSFNHFTVLRMKALFPEIKCGFLVGDWIVDLGKYAAEHGVEYVHPCYIMLNEDSIKEIHSQGIGINPWTVNNEDDVRRFYKLGLNSVITNYPDMAKEVIETL